jgi:hypothetical protein
MPTAFTEAVAEAKIEVADDERLSPHSLRHTYTSHLIVGLELDAATASKLAGHANLQVTMRVHADDFRRASERNAAVPPVPLSVAPGPDLGPDQACHHRRARQPQNDKSSHLQGFRLERMMGLEPTTFCMAMNPGEYQAASWTVQTRTADHFRFRP